MRRRLGIGWGSLSGGVGILAPLAFYAATLLPGVAFWDTGEMQTVPTILGIAHPTGFPLFVLGGWLFVHAVPFGEPAWRLSLASALAVACAAGLLAAFVTESTGDGAIGAGSALLFALGDVVWTRATRADVHDVALACIALALTAALRAARTQSPRTLGIAALACGLGIAVHPVALLAVPAAVVIAWPAFAAVSMRARFAVPAIGLAPLALYAYLPVRSAYVEAHALDPAAALGIAGGAFWDDDAPASPGGFVRYVSGAAFAPENAALAAFTPGGLGHALAFALGAAYREDGVLALALALCGFAVLVVRAPRTAAGLASLVALDAAFAASYGPESDPDRYLLGAFWALSAYAGVGAWWLARALAGAHRARLASACGAALVLAALWPGASFAARDLARERRSIDARAYVATVERIAAPDSLVIASWSFATPLAYAAYVTRTLRPRLVCGWPLDFADRLPAWRRRFAHVYFVTSPAYPALPFARRIASTDRYVVSEMLP